MPDTKPEPWAARVAARDKKLAEHGAQCDRTAEGLRRQIAEVETQRLHASESINAAFAADDRRITSKFVADARSILSPLVAAYITEAARAPAGKIDRALGELLARELRELQPRNEMARAYRVLGDAFIEHVAQAVPGVLNSAGLQSDYGGAGYFTSLARLSDALGSASAMQSALGEIEASVHRISLRHRDTAPTPGARARWGVVRQHDPIALAEFDAAQEAERRAAYAASHVPTGARVGGARFA